MRPEGGAGTPRRGFDLPHLTFAGVSQAVRCGDALHVSGQVALGPEGVVGDDAASQAEQCFDNLQGVLAAAGSDLADVVKLTCYLTDAADYPAYAEAKNRRFGSPAPAGTCVVVAALLDPRFLLEVEAVAVVGSGTGS